MISFIMFCHVNFFIYYFAVVHRLPKNFMQIKHDQSYGKTADVNYQG